MAVNPKHRYSNEAERANQGIYDDIKLKITTLCSLYKKNILVLEGLNDGPTAGQRL